MADAEFNRWRVQCEVAEQEYDRLSDWERDFITQVSDQLTRTGKLSIRQAACLERIYGKVV